MTAADDPRPSPGFGLRAGGLAVSSAILSWLSLLLGGYVLVSTLRVAHASYWPGPIDEYWDFLATIQHFTDGDANLAVLLEPFGGHRLFVSKLIYVWDYVGFGGRNLLTFFTSWLFQFGVAAAFIAIVRRRRDRIGASSTRFLVGLTLVLLFSSTQIENFVRAWHVHWFIANGFACLAFGAVALSSDRNSRDQTLASHVWLGISLSAAWCATFSMANGLLVWPILILVAAGMSMSRGRFAWIVLAGAAAVLAFFVDYEPTRGGDGSSLVAQPTALLKWFLLCVGMPLSKSSPIAGGMLACIGIAAAGVLIVRSCLQRREVARADWILIATLLFFLGSVALVTSGRASRWPDTWSAARYQTVVLPFWLSLAILVVSRLRAASAACFATLVGVLGLVTLVGLPAHVEKGREAVTRAHRVNFANRAITVGIRDRKVYAEVVSGFQIHRKGDVVQRHRPFLIEHGLAMFGTEEARRVGTRFESGPAECASHLGAARAVGDSTVGYLAVGSVEGDGKRRLWRILVLDGRRTVIGLGGGKGTEGDPEGAHTFYAHFVEPTGGDVSFVVETPEGRMCLLRRN